MYVFTLSEVVGWKTSSFLKCSEPIHFSGCYCKRGLSGALESQPNYFLLKNFSLCGVLNIIIYQLISLLLYVPLQPCEPHK